MLINGLTGPLLFVFNVFLFSNCYNVLHESDLYFLLSILDTRGRQINGLLFHELCT